MQYVEYEGIKYPYLDVEFDIGSGFVTERVGDERLWQLDRDDDREWLALNEQFYCYVPEDVLEQGEDAVLAYMKDNGYDMPEVY